MLTRHSLILAAVTLIFRSETRLMSIFFLEILVMIKFAAYYIRLSNVTARPIGSFYTPFQISIN